MNVVITGGTGFIGRAVVRRLLASRHHVTVITRSVDRLAARLGPDVEGIDTKDKAGIDHAVGTSDAVINLAGESIVGGRWTAAQKQRLRDSRILLTESLVSAIAKAKTPPTVLVSASAVGYYGDAGQLECTETVPPGDDFLAQLCVDWERAARKAEALGVRVAIPRIGIVLGKNGGALAKMLPAFKMGLGGVVGSGEQYFSWIHRDDLASLIVRALTDERMCGPFNATAPEPVTNRVFTQALGSVLKRPTFIPVPAFALKAALGESSMALLTGQRAVPAAVMNWGASLSTRRWLKHSRTY